MGSVVAPVGRLWTGDQPPAPFGTGLGDFDATPSYPAA